MKQRMYVTEVRISVVYFGPVLIYGMIEMMTWQGYISPQILCGSLA